MDCGPTCLRMIARYHGRIYSRELLRDRCYIQRDGVSLGGIADGAESIGFQSLPLSTDYETLTEDILLPCIAYWRQRHFIVVHKVSKKYVYVADPAYGLTKYSREEFEKGWYSSKNDNGNKEGLLLILETTPDFFSSEDDPPKKGLGLRFLIPYFKPYSKINNPNFSWVNRYEPDTTCFSFSNSKHC